MCAFLATEESYSELPSEFPLNWPKRNEKMANEFILLDLLLYLKEKHLCISILAVENVPIP